MQATKIRFRPVLSQSRAGSRKATHRYKANRQNKGGRLKPESTPRDPQTLEPRTPCVLPTDNHQAEPVGLPGRPDDLRLIHPRERAPGPVGQERGCAGRWRARLRVTVRISASGPSRSRAVPAGHLDRWPTTHRLDDHSWRRCDRPSANATSSRTSTRTTSKMKCPDKTFVGQVGSHATWEDTNHRTATR
jgi:hypothetical protein